MKFIPFLYAILISSTILAQVDTVKTFYLNGKLESLLTMENNIRQGEAFYYWQNGNVKEHRNYLNDKITGTVSTYYENGNRKEIYYLEDGKRNGPATYYDSTDTLIEYVIFENGIREGQDYSLISKKRKKDFDELLAEWEIKERRKIRESKEGNLPPGQENNSDGINDSIYYTDIDVMPEPIGGMNTIYRRLNYPKEAAEKKIEGVVKIKVFIEKDGEVSSAEVVEGIGYGCDENARLSVYYTRFKPGLQKGKRVKVQMIIPVEFKLSPR